MLRTGASSGPDGGIIAPWTTTGDPMAKNASMPIHVSPLAVALAIAGCCSARMTGPTSVPEALRPPPTQYAYLEALASGVQIHECATKAGGGYEWAFKAPEATLTDRSGRPLGKHYAGPTWESDDGSKVAGEVKARDPGPSPTAIAWLLLAAKGSSGSGVFSTTRSILRVDTTGGLPPTETCAAANVGEVRRVPYTATYYFYRDKP